MTARHLCLLCAPLAVVALSGCGPEEEIQQYRVSKPHVVFESNHVDRDATPGAAASPAARGEAVPTRTLAALVPHGEQTWFFKLTGPDKAVAAREADFRKLVGSVRFSGPQARPEWTVPEGWTQASGGGEMRFATLQTKSDGESLEATVIPLPSAEGDFDEYVLANINRWRNQLGLEAIGANDLPENTTRIALPEGNGEATLVNLAGEAAQGGGPPFAPFAGGQGMLRSGSRTPPRARKLSRRLALLASSGSTPGPGEPPAPKW